MTVVVIGELTLTGSDYLFKCAFHLPIFKSLSLHNGHEATKPQKSMNSKFLTKQHLAVC